MEGARFRTDPHLDGRSMDTAVDPRQKIEDVLESIRPALRSDGGDVELIDFDQDDGIVQVRLVGACGSAAPPAYTFPGPRTAPRRRWQDAESRGASS